MEPRTRQLPLDPPHRVFAAAGHVLPHEGAAGPGALAGRSRPERADALLRPPGDRPDLPPATLRRALPLLVGLRAGQRAPDRGARRPRTGLAPVQAAGAGARALTRAAADVGRRAPPGSPLWCSSAAAGRFGRAPDSATS